MTPPINFLTQEQHKQKRGRDPGALPPRTSTASTHRSEAPRQVSPRNHRPVPCAASSAAALAGELRDAAAPSLARTRRARRPVLPQSRRAAGVTGPGSAYDPAVLASCPANTGRERKDPRSAKPGPLTLSLLMPCRAPESCGSYPASAPSELTARHLKSFQVSAFVDLLDRVSPGRAASSKPPSPSEAAGLGRINHYL